MADNYTPEDFCGPDGFHLTTTYDVAAGKYRHRVMRGYGYLSDDDVVRLNLYTLPEPEPPTVTPPWRDYRDKMPTNPTPDASSTLSRRAGWWRRSLDDIDGVTIHHTLSHNPEGLAAYITKPKANGGKGYPTTQYHVWITAEGDALWCVDFEEGLWHDHCGDKNTHISIGMAGRLHEGKPPQVQLNKAAEVSAYLMDVFDIEASHVAGHNDWALLFSKVHTVCPGWDVAGWRNDFYTALNKYRGIG